ncbi:hypothetical protein PHMEG_00019593 [Phytophthora megakarya]|uniref:Retrotransposon gag domain-containing protein n=1 Tax=Phytophthora megakarya TaxID=4795 RepID=A0A225VRI5_9STRA|nr:hypothetical protein PHMEG_00019593 [Phytophthora megakarya]
MTEESSLFVTMISCHLGTTPMNWYRQFSLECDATDTTMSWPMFKSAMRCRFLPPDHEFSIRERLCALRQKGNIHDYIAELQNLLIQCTLPISPLELRFYFQEGLKAATAKHLREHHPDNLEQTIELALRFDHSSHSLPPASDCRLGDNCNVSPLQQGGPHRSQLPRQVSLRLLKEVV